jgi:hypothetical protein
MAGNPLADPVDGFFAVLFWDRTCSPPGTDFLPTGIALPSLVMVSFLVGYPWKFGRDWYNGIDYSQPGAWKIPNWAVSLNDDLIRAGVSAPSVLVGGEPAIPATSRCRHVDLDRPGAWVGTERRTRPVFLVVFRAVPNGL